MKQPIAVALAAVAVAAAACGGFFAGRQSAAKAAEPAPAEEKTDDAAAARKLADAQKRVTELEGQVAKLRGDLTKKLSANAKTDKNANAKDSDVIKISGDNVDILGELKNHLSEEQFSQATNALEQMKMKLANKAKGRMDFLASVDTSSMTEAERKNHERFLELMAKKEAIAAKMKGPIPDVKAIQEMVMLEMEMRPAAKRERSTLVRQVAKELGYSGDDVDVIHDTLNNVYDSTGGGGGIAGIGDMMDEAIPADAEIGVGVETIVAPPVIKIQSAPAEPEP